MSRLPRTSDQIVMVTTPNSLKYLKFAGGLTEKNIRQWAAHTDCTFGVVKYDKGTRFFHGKMVQSSYQLLNTLSLSEEEVKHLLQPSIDYISLLRRDIDFMRYHFTDAFAREKDGEEEHMDGLAERADVIFTLMHKCPHFDETELYANFRDDVVRSLKERLEARAYSVKRHERHPLRERRGTFEISRGRRHHKRIKTGTDPLRTL